MEPLGFLIKSNRTLHAGATVLGGETLIGKGSVLGGNVWVVRSIPSYSKVTSTSLDYSKLESPFKIKYQCLLDRTRLEFFPNEACLWLEGLRN